MAPQILDEIKQRYLELEADSDTGIVCYNDLRARCNIVQKIPEDTLLSWLAVMKKKKLLDSEVIGARLYIYRTDADFTKFNL